MIEDIKLIGFWIFRKDKLCSAFK